MRIAARAIAHRIVESPDYFGEDDYLIRGAVAGAERMFF
jgi:hypothetical protein